MVGFCRKGVSGLLEAIGGICRPMHGLTIVFGSIVLVVPLASQNSPTIGRGTPSDCSGSSRRRIVARVGRHSPEDLSECLQREGAVEDRGGRRVEAVVAAGAGAEYRELRACRRGRS